MSPRFKWITEFNNFNDGPPVWEGSADPGRVQALQAQPAVAEGDRIEFLDLVDRALVPATVRKVVTDGTTSVALWVADQEWEARWAWPCSDEPIPAPTRPAEPVLPRGTLRERR